MRSKYRIVLTLLLFFVVSFLLATLYYFVVKQPDVDAVSRNSSIYIAVADKKLISELMKFYDVSNQKAFFYQGKEVLNIQDLRKIHFILTSEPGQYYIVRDSKTEQIRESFSFDYFPQERAFVIYYYLSASQIGQSDEKLLTELINVAFSRSIGYLGHDPFSASQQDEEQSLLDIQKHSIMNRNNLYLEVKKL